MRGVQHIWQVLVIAMLCYPVMGFAQEEESADITTALVEDVFQDKFFEALKQKGIGNYDRALNYLVQCKELEPEEAAVDYELGRIYLLTRQFIAAEDHLLKALNAEPSNIWYLTAVVQLYHEEKAMDKAVKVAAEYQQYGWEQQLLLADLYVKSEEFEKARAIMTAVDQSSGSKASAATRRLELAMISSERTESKETAPGRSEGTPENSKENSVDGYRMNLERLKTDQQYDELLLKSTDAVDNFPAQPEFYYYRSLSLLKTGEPEQALAVAEEGLAYLLEDNVLENAFYLVMKEAYAALGDEEKVKEIEKKIDKKAN